MAKALKIGDKVKVIKAVEFKPDSPEYQNGLESIQPGEIGEVIGPGQGRAVIVDLNGKQAPISVQRLELIQTKKGRPGRPKGKTKQTQAKVAATPKAARVDKPHAATKSYDPTLINLIANKLLLGGGIQPNATPVVEISLTDLPDELVDQVKKLVEAKLSLGADNLPSKGRSK